MSQKYQPEMIRRIEELRSEGFSWADVAKEVCRVYEITATGENLRKAYNYYHAEDETLGESIIVESAVRARRAQMSAARERKVSKALTNSLIGRETILDGIREAVKGVNAFKPNQSGKKKSEGGNGIPMTTELLLSDLQIGKLMPNYNTEIALKRLNTYTEAAIFKMRQHIKAGYRMERLVLAMMGDIIESDKKHKNSGRATDTGTASQIKNAIEGIYNLVIKPLATFCQYHDIKFDVICVGGNHDWDDHGLPMFDTGVELLSWPLYNALDMLCKEAGLPVTFDVAKGCFSSTEIYGHTAVYEHGVGVRSNEADMLRRAAQRGRQLHKHVTYFRVGDKHHISRFNEDTMVINGAFFGGDREGREYSGIMGYNSLPGQICFFHVPRDDKDRLPMYDSFVIQLGHIK